MIGSRHAQTETDLTEILLGEEREKNVDWQSRGGGGGGDAEETDLGSRIFRPPTAAERLANDWLRLSAACLS